MGKEERKPSLVFEPFTVGIRKRRLTLKADTVLNLSRLQRFSKIVSPNADILPAIKELFGVDFELSGEPQLVEIPDSEKYGKTVGLTGLLRAILLLKYKHPDVYREFMTVARWLSFTVDETSVKTPPLTYIGEHDVLQKVWSRVKAEVGVTQDEYFFAVTLAFKETGLLKEVALFKTTEEEDAEAVQNFVDRIEFPVWLADTKYSFEKEKLAFILSDIDDIDEVYEKFILSEISEIFSKGGEENDDGE